MRPIFTYLLIFLSGAISAQTISTVAGNGTWTCSGIGGGPASAAAVGQLYATTTDASGNIYIAASSCSKVLKIDPSGTITTYAGSGTSWVSGDGGPATAAEIGIPTSLAMDKFGNLFISDNSNSVIRKVNPAGIISTVAGDAMVIGGGYAGDGGPATASLLMWPEGIAVDTFGNLYVADNGNNMIRRISTTGIITRVAGTGSLTYSGDGGMALAAGLSTPRGIAVDVSGNIYVSDNMNHRVRKISAGGIITCLAGSGTMGYSGDGGPATAAEMKFPRGLAVDKYGNVYVADCANNAIRKIDGSNTITTFAGAGTPGHSGDGGSAFAAEINHPYDIAVDKNGYKYIAELNGAYLRKVDTCLPIVVSAITGDTSLCLGDVETLETLTTGGTWSISDPAVATIDASGTVSAVARGTATVTYAKDNGCATTLRIRNIVVGPFAGSIHRWSVVVGPSGVDTFAYATLSTAGAPGGTWGLTNTTVASISSWGNITPIVFFTADTAFYTITDSCGTETAYYPFYLRPEPVGLAWQANAENSTTLYPNPVTATLHISSPVRIGRMVIVNMPGKVVYETEGGSEMSIDVSTLPPGVYIVKGEGIPVRRFVKQ
ncbi:hypothetical protein GCM10023093_16700 [Nemorincola caseinilytica]|uniref:T9SS C-terminal target domain-containing protein n=1 Tax=Nemorincola caseinilytica TaxID=2054315 RepID=A0ABP8NFS1_9BACT